MGQQSLGFVVDPPPAKSNNIFSLHRLAVETKPFLNSGQLRLNRIYFQGTFNKAG